MLLTFCDGWTEKSDCGVSDSCPCKGRTLGVFNLPCCYSYKNKRLLFILHNRIVKKHLLALLRSWIFVSRYFGNGWIVFMSSAGATFQGVLVSVMMTLSSSKCYRRCLWLSLAYHGFTAHPCLVTCFLSETVFELVPWQKQSVWLLLQHSFEKLQKYPEWVR